jgi:hypothetical protein
MLMMRLMLISFPSLCVQSLHNLHKLIKHRGVSQDSCKIFLQRLLSFVRVHQYIC